MTDSTFRRTAVASICLLFASALAADEAYLVRDIHPSAGMGLGSTPRLVPFGDDRALLFASEEDHGFELWITDGTAAGTRLLRDICPGRCSSDPRFQGVLGDRILFSARAAAGDPARLWITDGTWAGTRALGSGAVGNTAAVGTLEDRGLFFFTAEHDGDSGLWVTDGTPAGTRPLALDGPDGWPRFPHGGASGSGRLVFGAQASEGGDATWVTDGTDEGTRRLAAIPPGRLPSRLNTLQRFGSQTAVFTHTAAGSACETELWLTDGTPAGTARRLVFDTFFCQQIARFFFVVEADGAIWFVGRQGAEPPQLWRSDGTEAGTRAVTSFTGIAFAEELIDSGDGAVLFAAADGVHGLEPWIADAAGARLLADICPGECPSSPGNASIPGAFYFAADGGPLLGRELWRREADAAVLVEDVCPGACGSSPFPLGAAGGTAFFIAGQAGDVPGRELWATPLGGNGAGPVSDFAADNPFPVTSVFSFSASTVGERLVFTADDGVHGPEVWRSDGTPGGTVLVEDIETRGEPGAGSLPALLTPWNDSLLFFALEPGTIGWQPWISDGTEPGTRRLGVVSDSESSVLRYSEPVILGSDALFTAADGFGAPLELWRARGAGAPVRLVEIGPGSPLTLTSARLGNRAVFLVPGSPNAAGEVWASDGTAAGSRRLANLKLPGSGSGVIEGDRTGELGGRLFFGATDDFEGGDGFGLWATDGTPGGTVQVSPIFANREARPPGAFARLGGRLLFAADGDGTGRELWRTDGSGAGTEMVADLLEGDLGSSPFGLTTAGDRVYFFASELTGTALWTTDGTATGTVRISAAPGYVEIDRRLPQRAVAGGRFYFATAGPRSDLWVSDGTAAGTGSLAPLLPPNADVIGVWSGGDRVWLSIVVPGAFEDTAELWQSDGTLAGTRRLVSLPSMPGVAAISDLAQVGSLLFFRGLDPEAGQELMALPLGPAEPCSADAETLCLGDGRFAVRARWRDPRSGDSGTAGALPLPGSDRTGLFWFFAPDNVELVVKNLAAGPVNGYFWNFYGALSDVEYEIEVTDTATGRRVEYFNPGGEICGRGDTTAFPARPPVPLPVPAPAAAPVRATAAGGTAGTACGGSAGDLCLLGGRFRVEVDWKDQRSGDTGAGTAIPYADRSGFFWFFDDENVELVVKMLDGRQVNGRFWFFYGALSDVEYTITVTDTETGGQASYHNPPGEICGRGDTAAF